MVAKQVLGKTLTASAVIGRHRKYSKNLIPISEIKEAILKAQIEIRDNYKVMLSAKISPCEILFLGQEEPSVSLEFIQYPKFIYNEEDWRKAVIALINVMMNELEQNRVVIIFPDNTIMLEKTKEIDPEIITGK